jgi:hypothetical protein
MLHSHTHIKETWAKMLKIVIKGKSTCLYIQSYIKGTFRHVSETLTKPDKVRAFHLVVPLGFSGSITLFHRLSQSTG